MTKTILFSSLFALAVLFGGCAHKNFADRVASQRPQDQPPTRNRMSSPDKALESLPENASVEQIESLTIGDVIRMEEPNTTALYDNSRYDFPITMNSKVEAWIDYFTGRGRRHMERYLTRSSRYIPLMKGMFRKEGLPEDLVYICLIESGFNLRARSRASAVGPWQFMAATGKRYGLDVTFWVDERRDFIRSTNAAAKHLKDLYLMFESWYLAAAAYNAGQGKIQRAIERAKTNNFWRIARTRYIRRETKDYVPKLISAAIIAKNPTKFGFDDLTYQDPIEYSTVKTEYSLHLHDIARLIGVPRQQLLDLNPELRRGMIPPDAKNYLLRVPKGKETLVKRALVAKKSSLRKKMLPYTVKVRWGDSLYAIARRYGVSLRELRAVNNLKPKRSRIYPGMKLIIPTDDLKAGKPKRRLASAKKKKRARKSARRRSKNFVTHVVRRGESLWSIAVKYNVTVKKLFEWNRLRRSKIFPGKRLKVRPS